MRALVASEKNAAKSEKLRLMNYARFCIWVWFAEVVFDFLMLRFCFAVSDANLHVEIQLCDIAFPKGLLGILGQFSATL
ncbi:hypothetical protein [Shewanella sp. SG41-3]|uniref:hypothetical protein n=1 Tax=Shewanella sp. SG41-3 TaxID=2760977 RepID=UPI001601B613|nr:hypothetical protein [Shewanella sp. SG41-3]MBB1477373.1 hypothetical protein [Shewanella sp. SG41-3]